MNKLSYGSVESLKLALRDIINSIETIGEVISALPTDEEKFLPLARSEVRNQDKYFELATDKQRRLVINLAEKKIADSDKRQSFISDINEISKNEANIRIKELIAA